MHCLALVLGGSGHLAATFRNDGECMFARDGYIYLEDTPMA